MLHDDFQQRFFCGVDEHVVQGVRFFALSIIEGGFNTCAHTFFKIFFAHAANLEILVESWPVELVVDGSVALWAALSGHKG